MNPRQKNYESYDSNNKLLKLTNSYYHFRNMEYIKNRPSLYSPQPLSFGLRRKQMSFANLQAYNIKKTNQTIKNKLQKILLKPIKPQMNDIFLAKDKKLKEIRKAQQDKYNKIIDTDNRNLKKRLLNQRAFINSKMLDRLYDYKHSESLMKLKKKRKYRNYFLPKIKSTSENLSFLDFMKYYNSETARSNKDEYKNMSKKKQNNFSSANLSNYDYNSNKDTSTN